jgi:hypothetical protein
MTTTTNTETWTNADPKAARKAIAAAALAVSEFKLGNEEASETAAYRAGQLTHRAGFTVAQLGDECRELLKTGNCWSFAVDGWYDAQGADRAAA